MSLLDALRLPCPVKDDAVLFVQFAHEVAQLRPQHLFERARVRRHHVHLEPALAQRRRGFEPDEAGAEHDRALGGAELVDDGAGCHPSVRR